MDVTVYLPNQLGERAKREGINLSRTLRNAVQVEIERREAVSNTLSGTEVYELALEDDDGTPITGRIRGTLLVDDDRGSTVYLTADERVIVHDEKRLRYEVVNDPQNELRGLTPGNYATVMKALGLRAVIDL